MNIKKATTLISPDSLISTRRSSLPLTSLEINRVDSVGEVLRKIKVSPHTDVTVENKGQMIIPKILLDSTRSLSRTLSDINLSFGNLSPISSSDSLFLSSSFAQPKDVKKFNGSKWENEIDVSFHSLARRASCGPTLLTSSPDAWSKNCIWSKQVHSKTLSPIHWSPKTPYTPEFQPVKQNDKRNDESHSSRNQSYLRCPSLSPCFEDKAKSSNFPSSTTSEANVFNSSHVWYGFACDLNQETRQSFSIGRRASVHNIIYQCPDFRHSGISPLDPKQRRKSLDVATINVPECLDKNNNVDELDKGNIGLIKGAKLLTINSLIGKGGFGIVKVGSWKGEKVAVKAIIGKRALSSFENERKSLSIAPHLHLVRTKAVVVPENTQEARIESSSSREAENTPRVTAVRILLDLLGVNDDLFSVPNFSKSTWSLVISELCTPTTLLTLINCTCDISDIDKLRIIRQIASALNHMHSAGFVHLDVKPANCFLTPCGIIKLGDFGCICRINETPTHPLGTVAYQSPEALQGEAVTDRSDIYSLGITAWQVLYRETPFAGYHPHVIIYGVARMNHRPESSSQVMLTFIETALLSVIERCWSKLPYERPSAASILRITTALSYSLE